MSENQTTEDTIRAKLAQVEDEFRTTREQETFFRQKADEAAALRQQLIGKAAAFRELLPTDAEAQAEPEPA